MVFISITSGEFNPCGDLTDNPTDKIHYLSVTRRDAKPKLAISVVSHDAPLLHFKVGFSQNRLFVRLFHFLLTIDDQWEESDRYISGISNMIWPGYLTERHMSVTFTVMMMLWYISFRNTTQKPTPKTKIQPTYWQFKNLSNLSDIFFRDIFSQKKSEKLTFR